jgi:voltage-gated potassium channel
MSESNVQPKLTFLQCLILVLSIYVLIALFVQTVIPLTPETDRLIDRIDFAICLVFLYDFFRRLWHAPSKLGFLKWGWIDLISSIPMFDFLRWGRLVRIIRILRILRAFRSTKVLLTFLFQNRANGTFASVAMFSVVMVIFASIAILNLENAAESNIKTPADALWWAFATITTVGYGDRFPVTHEGRIVAAVLMTVGVGLFGTFTAYVATSFLEVGHKKESNDIEVLIEEVRQLRVQVEALTQKENSPV